MDNKMNVLAVIAACCGVLAVILWLFTWQWEIYEAGATLHSKGFACVFGGKASFEISGFTASQKFTKASVGGIITLALIVLGTAAALAAMFGDDFSFIYGIVAGICLVVSGILLFCGTTDLMVNPIHGKMSDSDGVNLGVGCILAAIAAISGGVVALCGSLIKKIK